MAAPPRPRLGGVDCRGMRAQRHTCRPMRRVDCEAHVVNRGVAPHSATCCAIVQRNVQRVHNTVVMRDGVKSKPRSAKAIGVLVRAFFEVHSEPFGQNSFGEKSGGYRCLRTTV